MRPCLGFLAVLLLSAVAPAFAADLTRPLAAKSLVFEEREGWAAVEAEHFHRQTLTDKRAWHITSAHHTPEAMPDGDPPHVDSAAGAAYVEVLPDTRRTHSDKLIHGENFSNKAGQMAVLHYQVHFNNAGRYYVCVRAHSTGSEDNGLHVGLDGSWPESGQRLQWCEGKKTWRWESKQRTEEEHCGVPHAIYLDIGKPGLHEIQFSMREDGFEFDRFILTRDRDFTPPPDGGAAPHVRAGKLPSIAKP